MISIITPVWNNANLTAQYLYTHNIHYPAPPDIEWIIIDNGSTDGTGGILQYWKDIFGPSLKIIKNKENLGFSKANNQGVEQSQKDILVFLNNDIIVVGDYITPLEKALADNPFSIAGPQLIDVDTGWNRFGGETFSYLAGWCVAMKHATYEQLGGFDERYGLAYYEDIDLCYNALRNDCALQRIWLPLRHLGEQTGNRLPKKRELTEANRKKFAEKWGLNYDFG